MARRWVEQLLCALCQIEGMTHANHKNDVKGTPISQPRTRPHRKRVRRISALMAPATTRRLMATLLPCQRGGRQLTHPPRRDNLTIYLSAASRPDGFQTDPLPAG